MLRVSCWRGCPESLRADSWRVLLGLVPSARCEWAGTLARSRAEYFEFRRVTMGSRLGQPGGFESEISACVENGEGGTGGEGERKRDKVFNEIHNDVKRTHSAVAFFSDHAHLVALRNILFVFAVLNPGTGYVQGLNEIVAALYFVFAHDDAEGDAAVRFASAEADTFSAFSRLMATDGLLDYFCSDLDDDECGIGGAIRQTDEALRRCGPEIWANMARRKVEPQFYTFRWLTLLFAKEFTLPDLFRLWDSLFSLRPHDRLVFLRYLAVAILLSHGHVLAHEDLPEILTLLHNLPDCDVDSLIASAQALRDKDARNIRALSPVQRYLASPKKIAPLPAAFDDDDRAAGVLGGNGAKWWAKVVDQAKALKQELTAKARKIE
jgi:hypothetical protein